MLQPVADEILTAARQSAGNIDETSMGKGRWLWVIVTALGTAFQIVSGRNREELLKLIGDLTNNRHSLYSHLPAGRHQYCWAHLRRDFQAMIDRNNGGSDVGRTLLRLSDELFGLWKRVWNGRLTRQAFTSKMTRPGVFRTRLAVALDRGRACSCAKTRGKCGQLTARGVSVHVRVPHGVEPTNNAAERAIRHGVIWRKQSHGPKSEAGAKYLANIWSVVETCRQLGRQVWDFLADCFDVAQAGRPLPRLVAPKVQPLAA